MARRKQAPKDLTGIRQRGGRYQIRLFGGQDPVTGKQVMLTGSAEDEDSAIKLRDKFRRQVAEATAARTSVTLGYLLDEWLAGHQVEETTRTSYGVAIENFLKPAIGDTSLSRLAQLGARPFEQLYAELRVCRRRCKGRTFIEHRTHREHRCDKRCAPHRCRPLSVSSVRECHAVLSGALSAALRWGWIAVNSLEAVKRPRQQHPKPDPPTAEEAARIVSAAWEQDGDWGTFVWLTFITGARRGELLGLAWAHLDLPAGLLTIRRNLVRQNGTVVLKETKTHQMRVVSLDPDTVAILTAHQQQAQRRCTELGTTLDDDAFVFSYAPDHRRHCDPDGISHRYTKMTADLGIDTHLHALRHYSATELIAAGVDVRDLDVFVGVAHRQ
jgi:integrase